MAEKHNTSSIILLAELASLVFAFFSIGTSAVAAATVEQRATLPNIEHISHLEFCRIILGKLTAGPETQYVLAEREANYKIRPPNRSEKSFFNKVSNGTFGLLPAFERPSVLSFLIDGRTDPIHEGYYGPSRIIIPEYLFDSASKIGEDAEAVLAHELGHEFFLVNIRRWKKGLFVDAWRTAFQDYEKANAFLIQKIKKLQAKGIKIKSYSISELDPEDRIQYRGLNQAHFDLEIQTLDYQELFADLLQALYVDNPSIGKELTLRMYQKKGGGSKWLEEHIEEMADMRDFRTNHTPESMGNLDKSLRDTHHNLAAVRGFIGKRYLPKVKSLSEVQKQLLLEMVFQAIGDEINARYNPRTKKLREKKPADLNSDLIDRIQEKLNDKF